MSRPMFDEMNANATSVRTHYESYQRWLSQQPADVMQARRAESEMIFRRVGITFAAYGDKDEDASLENGGTERLIPFDLIPRIIPAHEWASMEKGLVQRVTALNRFIHDVYHDQEIIKAGLIPAEQIFQNAQFRPDMTGVDVPGNIYSHISGIDIVRAPNVQGEGEYYVLEDNLRVPSGVSYMLEDRKMMMRIFPELFSQNRVAPVAHYPDLLLETLRQMAPPATAEPTVVVLTPGMYSSAYFEHAFLAHRHRARGGLVCQPIWQCLSRNFNGRLRAGRDGARSAALCGRTTASTTRCKILIFCRLNAASLRMPRKNFLRALRAD